jgi:hypothetical protein
MVQEAAAVITPLPLPGYVTWIRVINGLRFYAGLFINSSTPTHEAIAPYIGAL